MPPSAWPFMRLGVVVVLVVAVDAATEELVDRGWRMELPVATILRIAASLSILRYPFAGFIVALEVDKWDWFWLAAGSRSEDFQAFYQQWDKFVDLVSFGPALLVAMRWRDAIGRKLAVGTLALRAVGVAAFLVTEQGWLLIVFPNVFETLFLLYVTFQVLTGRDLIFGGALPAAAVLSALLLPKVAQEYFLHVMDQRPWDVVSLPLPHRLEAALWYGLLYALPVLALMALMRRARSYAEDSDPTIPLTPL